MNRHKSKNSGDEDEEDEEENEIKLCGAKCRNVPGDIKAKFINTMFAD
jgi:hypothetical protein